MLSLHVWKSAEVLYRVFLVVMERASSKGIMLLGRDWFCKSWNIFKSIVCWTILLKIFCMLLKSILYASAGKVDTTQLNCKWEYLLTYTEHRSGLIKHWMELSYWWIFTELMAWMIFSCITDILRSLFSMSEPELLYWCLSLNFDTCADTWFLPDTGGWYNFGNYICHLWWSLISDIDMSSCHPINWSWEIFECFQLWDVKLLVGSGLRSTGLEVW